MVAGYLSSIHTVLVVMKRSEVLRILGVKSGSSGIRKEGGAPVSSKVPV